MRVKITAILSRYSRRLAVLAIALTTVFTSLLAFSPAAHAALSNCGQSPARVCIWEHAYFGGLQADYYNLVVGACYNVGSVMNDKATSMANHTPYKIRFYDNANCGFGGVAPFPLPPGAITSNLVLEAPPMNDEISSFMVWIN